MRGISASKYLAVAAVATMGCGSLASAAFIVQPDVDGVNNTPTAAGTKNPLMTYGNATATHSWGAAGTAVGLQPGNSAFGGGSATQDQYIFSYTPGTNADNTVFS